MPASLQEYAGSGSLDAASHVNAGTYAASMWESPVELWRRLKLGREEYLQRLMTTLIVGGDPPPWNTQCSPSDQGRRFLRLLDDVAHANGTEQASAEPETFIDEYLLPKLEEPAQNGWPDWAVLWPDRAWVIELKTEAASHRDDQLPYYLRLATAAHPDSRVDLTYITGPLSKPAPALLTGQRYSHLTWEQVLPLVEAVWRNDVRPEVVAYVEMVRTVIENLSVLRPAEQRRIVLGHHLEVSPTMPPAAVVDVPGASAATPDRGQEALGSRLNATDDLLSIARKTAADGRQRGVGATDPTDLEVLRDTARARIGELPADDATRFVLPWLWKAGRTDGRALTREGEEFGYELRFSRYQQMQVKP